MELTIPLEFKKQKKAYKNQIDNVLTETYLGPCQSSMMELF